MARDGLLTFICALGFLLIGGQSGLAAPPDDSSLADTLAVQSAIQQAREQLLRNHPREAVDILHRELGHINGNPVYLALLRDAYQVAIKELQLAHQDAEAQRYIKWLAILEPGTAREHGSPRSSPKPATASIQGKKPEKEASRLGAMLSRPAAISANMASEGGTTKASTPLASPKPSIVRASIDEDPFNDSRPSLEKAARDFLQRAEQEYSQRKFVEAGRLLAVGYKHDRWLDTVLMQRALGSGAGSPPTRP